MKLRQLHKQKTTLDRVVFILSLHYSLYANPYPLNLTHSSNAGELFLHFCFVLELIGHDL